MITTETASGKVLDEPVMHPEVQQVITVDINNIGTENDLDDNMKYFTDLEEDDDIEFNFDDFSGIRSQYSEHRFEGIII